MSLEKLSLKGSAAVAPQFIVKLVQRHHGIQRLNLTGARTLSCEDLGAIAEALGNGLLGLSLSECLHIRQDGLLQLAAYCGRLQKLKLVEGMNVTTAGLEGLVLNSRHLKCIDLSFCSRNGQKISAEVLEALPETLEKLVLTGVETSAPALVMLEVCPMLSRLTELNLGGFSLLSDSFLGQLLALLGPQLTALDLGGSFDKLSDEGLGHISTCCTNGLTKLGLNLMHRLSLEGLLGLLEDEHRAARLESLQLAACTGLSPHVVLALCRHASGLRRLDVSGVGGSVVSDAAVEGLVGVCGAGLEELFLRGNRELTDAAVFAVARGCPRLTALSLSGITNVTDAAMEELARHCHYLEEVALSGCMMISPQMLNYLQDECVGRVSIYHINPSAPPGAASTIAKNLDTGEYVWLQT